MSDQVTNYPCPVILRDRLSNGLFQDWLRIKLSNTLYQNWLKYRSRDLLTRDRKAGRTVRPVSPNTMQLVGKCKKFVLQSPKFDIEWYPVVTKSEYYSYINQAVLLAISPTASGEFGDFYTGEELLWGELAKDKDGIKRVGSCPTIDHVDPSIKRSRLVPKFVICRDDTNKMKTDLNIKDLHDKCKLMKKRDLTDTTGALKKLKEMRTSTLGVALKI